MADTVQYLLEQMVPELEDLERRGLFSRAEIKQIVKKRTEFEYRLKRRAALKEDFERYVGYENKLESLRLLRKSAIARKLKAANLRWRSSLADRAITRRIMFIYERAVRKFKGDLRLWLKYMEFCRAKGGTRQMQKVATKALQLHPTVPGLWMYAAAWEFEQNLNESAARALMQQGLRMCPKSESLWLEYLRLELTYVQKLKARQLLLGVGASEARSQVTAGKTQAEGKVASSADGEPSGSPSGMAQLDALSTSVARTIFQNAIAAVPKSVGFRQRFLELLQGADFAGREDVEEEVLESLAKDFSGSAACLDIRARRAMQQAKDKAQGSEKAQGSDEGLLEAVEAGSKVYEEGLASKPSVDGYRIYADFLEESLRQAEAVEGVASTDQSGHLATHVTAVTSLGERLAAVYQKAHEAGVSTERMAGRQVALLVQSGRGEEALQLVRTCCGGRFSTAGSLWTVRMSLELEQSGGRDGAAGFWGSAEGRRLKGLFRKALKAVPLAEAGPLWRLFMECMPRGEEDVEELLAMAAGALAGGGSAAGAPELACSVITRVLHLRGLGAARAGCDRLLALPGPSSELVQLCAQLEARAAVAGDPEALPRMRRAFGAVLDFRGASDSTLWLDYCRLELQVGSSEEATAAYWRAKKTLRDPTAFLARYQELVGGEGLG